jgi:predicted Zn-dependent protease
MSPQFDLTASRLEEEALRLGRHGSFKAAAEVCRTLTTNHPQFASGWRAASTIALQTGDAVAAMALIERSLSLAPKDSRSLLQKTLCLRALRRQPEALELAKSLREVLSDDAIALDSLGTFFSLSGEQQLALDAYDRALELAPRNTSIAFNRANVRSYLGQTNGAEEDYNQVIKSRPNDYEAYKNRSDLRTQTRENNHVAQLEKVLTRGIEEWSGEVEIRFALAKEYEDLGEYGHSWIHLEKGARLRRKHLVYHIDRDLATVDRLIEAYPTQVRSTSTQGKAAIFIVGLPRSGMTHVAKILATRAGPANFPRLLLETVLRSTNSTSMDREELIARSTEVDFAALGQAYLESAGHHQRASFTDNTPLNYLYCGLIHRALPQAKIVHLTRHPLAACYAMYQTLFKDGYPFSYKLEEIGRYYIAYRKLMAHWQATLPGVIHELSLESLAADHAAATRKLLDFCELAGMDAGPTPRLDMKLTQWRHYASQLDGLKNQLLAAGSNLS